MANEGKKPKNPPKGWHFKKFHVDEETGDVYQKGIYKPDLNSESPEVKDYLMEQVLDEEKEKETSQTETTDQKQESVYDSSQPPMVDGKPLSKETWETIMAMENIKAAKREERLTKAIELLAENLAKKEEVPVSSSTAEDFANAMVRAEMYKKGREWYKDIKDIDPNDYDERGATFTSYGGGYLILDDKRKDGHIIRTPYGRMFKFKFQGSRVHRVGRDQSYSCFCAFTTHSKKEMEWLRSHSLYGVEFYEDTNIALEADAFKIHVAAVIIRSLQQLDQPELIKKAKANGIEVGGDINIVRANLALRLAEEKFQQELESKRANVLSSYEAILMDTK